MAYINADNQYSVIVYSNKNTLSFSGCFCAEPLMEFLFLFFHAIGQSYATLERATGDDAAQIDS